MRYQGAAGIFRKWSLGIKQVFIYRCYRIRMRVYKGILKCS